MSAPSRFDLVAEQWDSNPVRVGLAKAVTAAIQRAVPIQPTWRALDYGAGTGLLTLNLLPHVASLIALDSSPGMLAQLAQKLTAAGIQNVQPLHWDLEQKPFTQSGFDLIVSSMTLHHIRDVPLVLRRLADLLNPGGWLACADLDTEDGSFHGQATDVFHQGFDRTRMADWFTKAGLTRVQTTDAHIVPKPTPTGTLHHYPVFLTSGQKP